MTKVHAGVKNSIIGKNVKPTIKFAPQFVLVLIPEPRDRTLRGKSSLCIHGTLPRPRAYAPTYNMTLVRTSRGAVRCERGIDSCADAEEDGLSAIKPLGNVMKRKPTLQRRSPMAMIGIE